MLSTALGFLLTSFSTAAVPNLGDTDGWPLAVGPASGIVVILRLESFR